MRQIINTIFAVLKKRIVDINHSGKEFTQGVSFLKINLPEEKYTIIDIGAADGTPALLKTFLPERYPYLLIEANPRFNNYLDFFKKNYSNAIIEKCFCGEVDGIVSFNINPSGRSSRYLKGKNSEVVQIPMKKLDSVVVNHELKGPFIIKIDVEGAELDVLKGAYNTLVSTEVVIVETWINTIIPENQRIFSELVSFMDQEGFAFYDFFGGSIYKSGLLKQIDAVFVKQNSQLRKIFI